MLYELIVIQSGFRLPNIIALFDYINSYGSPLFLGFGAWHYNTLILLKNIVLMYNLGHFKHSDYHLLAGWFCD